MKKGTVLARKVERIRQRLAQVRQLERQAKELRRRADRMAESLRQRIWDGKETTGDRLRDFAIVWHGGITDGKAVRTLRDLEKRLSRHPGQLVLIANWYEDQIRHGGPGDTPQPRDYGLYCGVSLGVVNGGQLVLDLRQGEWKIDTVKYCNGGASRDPSRYMGNMVPGWSGQSGTLPGAPFMNPMGLEAQRKAGEAQGAGQQFSCLEVIVGNKAVAAWFKWHEISQLFDWMKELLEETEPQGGR